MTREFTRLENWSGRVGNFLIGSLIVAIPFELYQIYQARTDANPFSVENYFLLGITVITLLLFVAVRWISKRLYYQLPITFEVAILIFIYLTLYVGDGHLIYWRYGWYDVVAHGLAGVALGFVGFLMLYIAMIRQKVLLPAFYAGLFAFSFSVMIGVLWEFFETFMDAYFGTTMVKGSGYDDIIGDLLGDTVGALFASVIGYLYVKGKEVALFGTMMDYFIELNQAKLDGDEPAQKN